MATGCSSTDKSSEELTLECDVCKYQGLTSQAISYCEICTEALCPVCDKVHRAAKRSRDHKLLTGSQLLTMLSTSKQTTSLMVCDKHQLPIQYFCNDDNDVFCNKCKLISHRACDTIDIATQVIKVNTSQIFGKLKSQLAELEKKHEQILQKRKEDKEVLKTKIQICFDDLSRIRQEICKILDDIEEKMKSDIRDAEEELSKEIDDHLVVTEDTLEQMQKTIELMKESESTQQDDIMFVASKKTECVLPKYEQITSNLEKEIQDCDVSINPNQQLREKLEHLRPFGNLINRPSFFDISVNKRRFYNVANTAVQSITTLPDGHVVLACFEDGLKLLDSNLKLKSELSIRAVEVCMVSDTEVLVSCGKQHKIQFVQVLPTMVLKGEISLGRICSGVDYFSDEIYVTCFDDPGNSGNFCNGEVQVLDCTGQVQRRLGFDGQTYTFSFPCHVKVTRKEDKVAVADMIQNCVICLNQQGRVIYRYSDTGLKGPIRILLDAYDRLLVCGQNSNNVHLVSSKGEKEKILLSKKNGINCPIGISYRQSDRCLIVGLHYKKKTSICTFHH